ncbi:hypothetical protein TEA_020009 [Camellia sinensis var. sinensis]|uniref:Clathrin/coatomer adaptor adaptin-like N-terminal domain-containing protein n=1 Tax=Camellia sinensis var. sinensis TaxID=542762 RepID=A0A4S4EPF1_CAMSN|nr:hypothetical protein TEA_020009 [Camellia sinensis var. sinensis]
MSYGLFRSVCCFFPAGYKLLSSRFIPLLALILVKCLMDPDNTLKRKTFELLYKMTKFSNLEVIVDCMIDYMTNINDHYKAEIASRCVELAEQFAPSNHCFIQTMNRVFKHAVDLVNIKVATT